MCSLVSAWSLINLTFQALRFHNIRLTLTIPLDTTCVDTPPLKPTTMILTWVIITFLSTIFMLLCGQTFKVHWKALNKEQKELATESTQGISSCKKGTKVKEQTEIGTLRWFWRKSYWREDWAHLRKDQGSLLKDKEKVFVITGRNEHPLIC